MTRLASTVGMQLAYAVAYAVAMAVPLMNVAFTCPSDPTSQLGPVECTSDGVVHPRESTCDRESEFIASRIMEHNEHGGTFVVFDRPLNRSAAVPTLEQVVRDLGTRLMGHEDDARQRHRSVLIVAMHVMIVLDMCVDRKASTRHPAELLRTCLLDDIDWYVNDATGLRSGRGRHSFRRALVYLETLFYETRPWNLLDLLCMPKDVVGDLLSMNKWTALEDRYACGDQADRSACSGGPSTADRFERIIYQREFQSDPRRFIETHHPACIHEMPYLRCDPAVWLIHHLMRGNF